MVPQWDRYVNARLILLKHPDRCLLVWRGSWKPRFPGTTHLVSIFYKGIVVSMYELGTIGRPL